MTANGHATPRVLTVERVSKRFLVQRVRPRTLRESLIHRLHGRRDRPATVWALRDVSFSLEQGVALGIVGHNGAGKSTLLRLLCGLGRPTSGRIERRGHVSGLLELGGGFHLDVSGRGNIVTAGMLSGLSEREARARQREIVAFAELEDFIDQPVRTYSTGMYVRLAFAVAICFEPAILVVDEVLAVGDSRFQQKCLERIAGFRAAGRTLLLTSHSREQMLALCDEVLVLDEGRAVLQSDPKTALACYDDLMRQRTERRARAVNGDRAMTCEPLNGGARQGTQEARVVAVRMTDDRERPLAAVQAAGGLTLAFDYQLSPNVPDLALVFGIYSDAHVKCFEMCIPSATAAFGPLGESGTLCCRLPELPLLAGRYYVNFGLYPPDFAYAYDHHWQIHILRVVAGGDRTGNASGVVALDPTWSLPCRQMALVDSGRPREPSC